jgi:hypothetical protein
MIRGRQRNSNYFKTHSGPRKNDWTETLFSIALSPEVTLYSLQSSVMNIFYYYYYYYYLLQLGFHPVAVVLTLVHTIQMDI